MAQALTRRVGGITALVGRQSRLAELRAELDQGTLLINVCGFGGVGKTRIVAELYRQVVDEQAYDVAGFVRLGPLFDMLDGAAEKPADGSEAAAPVLGDVLARGMCTAIASSLRLGNHSPKQADYDEAVKILADGIGDRRALLILDNCESDIDTVGDLVLDLLDAVPNLQVVTTSRELLHLPGERLFQMQPLAVPDSGATREEALEADAMTLFLDRARAVEAVSADMLAVPEYWDTLVRVVRASEGLPLLLELIAPQLGTRPASEILADLEADSGLSARVPGRKRRRMQRGHDQLESSVSFSWRPCSPVQQRLWARLCVFNGGFTRAAAEAVCVGGPIAAESVHELLQELVHRSILVFHPDDGRFTWQHGSLRAYGKRRHQELCRDEDDEDDGRLREQFCRWAEQFAAAAAAGWFGRDELEWLAAVRRELPNIESAVRWCKDTEQIDRGLAILTDVCRTRVQFFYALETHLAGLIDDLLAHPASRASMQRIGALSVLAFVRTVIGAPDRAREHIAEIDLLAPEISDAEDMPAVQAAKGTFRLFGESNSDALPLLEKAAAGFRALGMAGDAQMALLLWALGGGVLGPASVADRASRECLHHARSAGARYAVTWALWATGLPCLTSMQDVHQEVLRTQRDLGDLWGTTWAVEMRAWWLGLHGVTARDFRAAAMLLGASISLQSRHGVMISGLRPFDEWRAKVRDLIEKAIGSERFREAYDEGARLSTKEAFDLALQKPPPLSELLEPWQERIAYMLVSGRRNVDIAAALAKSVKTVEYHASRIYKIFGVKDRDGLTEHFRERGLLGPAEASTLPQST